MHNGDLVLPEGLRKVPPFPPVAARLLNLLADQQVDLSEVAELIGADGALTARLIQYVNSAVVGASRPVMNVGQAVMLLGFDRTRQLAVMSAASGFASRSAHNVESQRCWQHSLATAILADEIAKVCGVFSKTVFTAAILHDIGRLALLAVYPVEYARGIRDAGGRHLDLLRFERERFEVDHAEAGRLLAESWNLPAEFGFIAGRHHKSDPGAELSLLRIIQVACQLADTLGFGVVRPLGDSDGDLGEILDTLPPRVAHELPVTVTEMRSRVEAHMKKFL